jgi:hypothetical protein
MQKPPAPVRRSRRLVGGREEGVEALGRGLFAAGDELALDVDRATR